MIPGDDGVFVLSAKSASSCQRRVDTYYGGFHTLLCGYDQGATGGRDCLSVGATVLPIPVDLGLVML